MKFFLLFAALLSPIAAVAIPEAHENALEARSATTSSASGCKAPTSTSSSPTPTPTKSCKIFTLVTNGQYSTGQPVDNSGTTEGSNLYVGAVNSAAGAYFSLSSSGQLLALNVSSYPVCAPANPGTENQYLVEVGKPADLDKSATFANADYLPLLCTLPLTPDGPRLVCTYNNGTSGIFSRHNNGNTILFSQDGTNIDPPVTFFATCKS